MRAAFDALFDDAAMFPPGNVPMSKAVRAHQIHVADPKVGPLVCSLARLTELDAQLGGPISVAVVIPAGPFSLPRLTNVRLVGVERHVGAEGTTPDVPTYVELAALPATVAELDGIERVKFRTGGLRARDFPNEERLSAAIEAAVSAGVPFKCTAGLHAAVRHAGVDGYEHHGFLNILIASHAALSGASVVPVLAERDGGALAMKLRSLHSAEIAHARSAFVSFGTCSVTEPAEDLRALGLLE